MKKLAFLVLLLVFIGCISPPKTYKNKLFYLANSAPPETSMLMHLNVKKLLENPKLLEEASGSKVPEELPKLSFLFGDGGIIGTSEDEMVLVIQGLGFDILAGILPTVFGIFGNFIEDLPQIQREEYKNEAIYCPKAQNAPCYRIHEQKIFLGKEGELKKTIDAEKGNNATSKFFSLMAKLENDDVMIVMKPEEGIPTTIKGIGLTASLENKSKIKMVIETLNPMIAQMLAQSFQAQLPAMHTEMEIKSVSTENEFVVVEMEGKLEKLIELIGMMGSQPPGPFEGTSPGISPPSPTYGDLTGGGTLYPPTELPCSTEEECQEYCKQNPTECLNYIKEHAKSTCCVECITTFAQQGYGLDKLDMGCYSLVVSQECKQEFAETPLTVAECYKP